MKVNIIIFFLIISNINLFATFSKEGHIVRDSKTNLMWQDNSAVKSNAQKWQDALEYCEDLTLQSYSNWRLPNIRELTSISDDTKYDPAISSIFGNVASSTYWSASIPLGSTTYNAWIVNFKYGDNAWSARSNFHNVRCVR